MRPRAFSAAHRCTTAGACNDATCVKNSTAPSITLRRLKWFKTAARSGSLSSGVAPPRCPPGRNVSTTYTRHTGAEACMLRTVSCSRANMQGTSINARTYTSTSTRAGTKYKMIASFRCSQQPNPCLLHSFYRRGVWQAQRHDKLCQTPRVSSHQNAISRK